MNFEEMLNAQEGLTPKREKLTIGEFYRKQIDGKYRFVVDLKSSLTDSIAFCEALKAEEQWSLHQRSKHQLHYASKQEGNVLELELEGGNWQTLSQVMFANPAVVAQKGFVDQIVEGLMEAAQKLHADSVYHLCFAPQNIFLRKGDAMPMLLTHGSFYLSLGEQKDLYEGVENFMAPEVLAHGTIDERSDVYSLGKLIAFLYEQGSMPYEYKNVVKKATAENPDRRFKSIDEMQAALSQRRNTLRSVYALGATIVIALLCFWAYTEMMPTAGQMEFVDPVPQAVEGDPFDMPFDPESLEDDTLMTTEMDAIYQQKAEEIMRRREEREAEAKKQETEQKKTMRSRGSVEVEQDDSKE